MKRKLPLVTIKPRLDGLYEVARCATITCKDRGSLSIGPGFRFDGASIPRLLWRVCGGPFSSPRVVAALAHDWLYAAQVTSRADADKIYCELQIAYGISPFCALCEYYALRIFGWLAWRAKTHEDIVNARVNGIWSPTY